MQQLVLFRVIVELVGALPALLPSAGAEGRKESQPPTQGPPITLLQLCLLSPDTHLQKLPLPPASPEQELPMGLLLVPGVWLGSGFNLPPQTPPHSPKSVSLHRKCVTGLNPRVLMFQ